MLVQFADGARRYGLSLHFGKTKIMTWDKYSTGCRSIRVGDRDVSLLAETEAENGLGRKLCFGDSQDMELCTKQNLGRLGSLP